MWRYILVLVSIHSVTIKLCNCAPCETCNLKEPELETPQECCPCQESSLNQIPETNNYFIKDPFFKNSDSVPAGSENRPVVKENTQIDYVETYDEDLKEEEADSSNDYASTDLQYDQNEPTDESEETENIDVGEDLSILADDSPDARNVAEPEFQNDVRGRPNAEKDMDMSGKESVVISSITTANDCLSLQKPKPKPIFRPEVGFATSVLKHFRDANEKDLQEARLRASSGSSNKLGSTPQKASPPGNSIKLAKLPERPNDLVYSSATPSKSIAPKFQPFKLPSLKDTSGSSSKLSVSRVLAPESVKSSAKNTNRLGLASIKTPLLSIPKISKVPTLGNALVASRINSAVGKANNLAVHAPKRLETLSKVGAVVAKTTTNRLNSDANRLGNRLRMSQHKVLANPLLKSPTVLGASFIKPIEKPIARANFVSAGAPKSAFLLNPKIATDMINSASNLVNNKLSLFKSFANSEPVEPEATLRLNGKKIVDTSGGNNVLQLAPKFAKGFVDTAGDLVQNELTLISKLTDSQTKAIPNLKQTVFNPISRATEFGKKTEEDAIYLAPKFAEDLTNSLSNLVHSKLSLIKDLANNDGVGIPTSARLSQASILGGKGKAGNNRNLLKSNGFEDSEKVFEVLQKMREGIVGVLVGNSKQDNEIKERSRDASESASTNVKSICNPPKPERMRNDMIVQPEHLIKSKNPKQQRKISTKSNKNAKQTDLKPNSSIKLTQPLPSLPKTSPLKTVLAKLRENIPAVKSPLAQAKVSKGEEKAPLKSPKACSEKETDEKYTQKLSSVGLIKKDENTLNCKVVCTKDNN